MSQPSKLPYLIQQNVIGGSTPGVSSSDYKKATNQSVLPLTKLSTDQIEVLIDCVKEI